MDHRATSIMSDAPAYQAGDGGATPTVALFRKQDYEVREVSLAFAQEFTRLHHYSKGGSNTRVLTTGLFRRGRLEESEAVGITWWLPPTKSASMAHAPSNWNTVLACSRLAILDEVPCNAESFLLRHSMRFINRKRWPVLISYADDWSGHKGTIYKAAGWTESGKTAPERVYTLNGRMVSRKAGPKTRRHDEMLALGCVCEGSFSKTRWIHRV